VSRPTLPPDRPCWAVRAVRVAQAALAVVGLAVLAWTAAARPVPDPDPPRTRSVVVVTDTTGRLPAYTPVPAGPPCPAAEPQGASR
jgi:hypothetical protein